MAKNNPNRYFLANSVEPIIVSGTKEQSLGLTFFWGGNVIEDGVGDSTLISSNVGNFTIPIDELAVGKNIYRTYSKKHPRHPMNVLFRARIHRGKQGARNGAYADACREHAMGGHYDTAAAIPGGGLIT